MISEGTAQGGEQPTVSRADFLAALEIVAGYRACQPNGVSGTAEPRELLDELAVCERSIAILTALQFRTAVAFKRARVTEEAAAQVPVRQRGLGVAAELALARHESPAKCRTWLVLAESLVNELPATLTALSDGSLTPQRASLVARETACLDPAERKLVDAELATDPRFALMSDHEVAATARKIGYRRQPEIFTERHRRAEKDRCVSLRPVHDGMARFEVLTTLPHAVAMLAAVGSGADRARASGDARGRGQLQSDLAFERVTGLTAADGAPVEVQLVMTDRALLGASDEPAELSAPGLATYPVPAAIARDRLNRLREHDDPAVQAWVRRVWSDPTSGQLISMESSRREFGGNLRRVIVARDGVCRTPWCGAPIRHADHVDAFSAGGRTSAANGQGLCEACNYAKQARGWHSATDEGGAGGMVEITTPTGHTYRSQPPPLPGAPPLTNPPDDT